MPESVSSLLSSVLLNPVSGCRLAGLRPLKPALLAELIDGGRTPYHTFPRVLEGGCLREPLLATFDTAWTPVAPTFETDTSRVSQVISV